MPTSPNSTAELAPNMRLGAPASAAEPARPVAEIFRGSGVFAAPTVPLRRTLVANSEGDITMNFVNADVRDVAKAVSAISSN